MKLVRNTVELCTSFLQLNPLWVFAIGKAFHRATMSQHCFDTCSQKVVGLRWFYAITNVSFAEWNRA